MNILCKKNPGAERDPFDSSDRDFQGGAGKGDRPRNIGQRFAENYEQIDWHRQGPRPKRFRKKY